MSLEWHTPPREGSIYLILESALHLRPFHEKAVLYHSNILQHLLQNSKQNCAFSSSHQTVANSILETEQNIHEKKDQPKWHNAFWRYAAVFTALSSLEWYLKSKRKKIDICHCAKSCLRLNRQKKEILPSKYGQNRWWPSTRRPQSHGHWLTASVWWRLAK